MITPSSKWPSSVRGASGINLDLLTDQPLGRGGEGIVFRTKHARFAVKICNAMNDTPTEVDERLKRLRWLPLDGIPICRPLELLAPPDVGYVMELLEDMVALRSICEPSDEKLGPWYAAGGGLRRRLLLLARCAGILATLHDRGIVYSDVSPGNVLISAQQAHDEVWLVDADNLQTESSTVGRRLGTRFYTAPEVLRGDTGNTMFSDVYSFAVMAYETLTTNHPLVGDYVDEGPATYEDDAQRGLVPWIDHSTDDRNRTRHGYPAGLVLTRRLRELFLCASNKAWTTHELGPEPASGRMRCTQRPTVASCARAVRTASTPPGNGARGASGHALLCWWSPCGSSFHDWATAPPQYCQMMISLSCCSRGVRCW